MQSYTKDRSVYRHGQIWRSTVLGAGTGIPSQIRQLNKLTRTRTGYSNPGYRDQIRRHVNATTSMGGTFMSIDKQPSHMHFTCYEPIGASSSVQVPSGWEDARGDIAMSTLGSNPNPPDEPNTAAYSRAAAEAWKQIRAAQVSVSGPTFLGEARETMRMLKRPAQGLRTIAEDWLSFLKKKKKLEPKQWVEGLSGAWLEKSFGWDPLIQDAHDSMKAWNRLFDLPRMMPFSAFGSETTVDAPRSFTDRALQNNYCYFLCSRTALSVRLVKIRGSVKAEAKCGARAQLELFGFTQSEWLPTAWELLPWSFLVDYFTNIGDILTAGVTDRSSVAWCSRSDIALYEYFCNASPDFGYAKQILGINPQGRPNYISGYGSPGLVRWQRRRITRGASFELGVPELTFSIPGSAKQLANMAALLGQANALHRQSFHR